MLNSKFDQKGDIRGIFKFLNNLNLCYLCYSKSFVIRKIHDFEQVQIMYINDMLYNYINITFINVNFLEIKKRSPNSQT